MGIELQGSQLNYVSLIRVDNAITFGAGNRITLNDSRSPADLVAFQTTLRAILNDEAPGRIAIKLKPQSGAMMAGAAALKMECLLLVNSPCDVEFVSGARLKKVDPQTNPFPKYLQEAALVALAAT